MDGKEVFKLVRKLGMDSFSTIYVANVIDEKRKRDWGEVVVIKIPYNRDKEKSLIQELNLNFRLSKIVSENLVKYGFDLFDNKYVFVMEFVDGESLRSKIGEIGQQRQLDINEALDITKQICKGLSKIHDCRILHRDIQPYNIIITTSKVAKISDFSKSTDLKSSELASTTIGMVAYMPKEIIKGDGGFFYSDIYSLGVTLYEMVTGELPFDGKSIIELLDLICESDPIPPNERNREINDTLNAIIMKVLSKNVNDRYQSASEFLQALEYVS